MTMKLDLGGCGCPNRPNNAYHSILQTSKIKARIDRFLWLCSTLAPNGTFGGKLPNMTSSDPNLWIKLLREHQPVLPTTRSLQKLWLFASLPALNCVNEEARLPDHYHACKQTHAEVRNRSEASKNKFWLVRGRIELTKAFECGLRIAILNSTTTVLLYASRIVALFRHYSLRILSAASNFISHDRAT